MKIRKLVILLAVVLSLTLIAGCSARDVGTESGTYSMNYSSKSSPEEVYDAEIGNQIVITEDRLIVYYVDFDISVEDKAVSIGKIKAKLVELGGYEQSSYEYSSYTRLSMRVPTAKLDEFVSSIEAIGETNDKSVRSEDITENYESCAAKKEALLLKKAALEELLPSANTLDEKLKLTKEIQSVAEEIDRYSSKMSSYKKQADYSTVTVDVYKEGTYVPESVWTNIGNVFIGSLKSVGEFFGVIATVIIAVLPYCVIVLAGFGVYVLIKFIVCKATNRPFGLFTKARERKAIKRRQKELRDQQIKKDLGME